MGSDMEDRVLFIISGLAPAMGTQVNKFLAACDLGIEGAFVQFQHKLSANRNGQDDAGIMRDMATIKTRYEEMGCRDVTICRIR